MACGPALRALMPPARAPPGVGPKTRCFASARGASQIFYKIERYGSGPGRKHQGAKACFSHGSHTGEGSMLIVGGPKGTVHGTPDTVGSRFQSRVVAYGNGCLVAASLEGRVGSPDFFVGFSRTCESAPTLANSSKSLSHKFSKDYKAFGA
jgi:hypothetical protein